MQRELGVLKSQKSRKHRTKSRKTLIELQEISYNSINFESSELFQHTAFKIAESKRSQL